MSEQDEVQVPPTETEVAILTEVLAGGYRLIVRKLAFQRDRLQAEVERLRSEIDGRDDLGLPIWRPMKSAPRDGTEVLLLVERRAGEPGKCLVGHWTPGGHCIEDFPPIDAGWDLWNGCMFDLASKPLAWMPLPSTRGAEAAGGES